MGHYPLQDRRTTNNDVSSTDPEAARMMLELGRWVRFRWHLKPTIAVGDTNYGTAPNIVGLEHEGIRACCPRQI